MSSEWPVLPLEHCLEALIDYRGKTPEKTDHGIPLITAKVIKGGRIEEPTEFIAFDAYDTWMRRGIPRAGDVVLTTEAPLGEVAQLGNERVALAQRVVTLRGKGGVLDNTFLRYLLQTEAMQSQLVARATGTTVLGIKQSELRKVEIPVPPIYLQRSSASILASLDDRIALLRETNATLEAIAQTLFKSWFVDFDPVRAKSQGLAPAGMDEATAALFPDGFEESVLGPMPKGWQQGTVSDFAQLHRGSVVPGASADMLFEHYSLPAFDDGQMPVRERGAAIKSNKTPVPADGVLLSKLNPHIPRVWLPAAVGQHAVCSTEFLVFVPAANASKEFVYSALVAAPLQERLRQLVTGTSNSHQRVRPESVVTLSATIPPVHLLDAFTAVVRPLLARVGRNRHQAQTLAAIRDTLLPRLVSGQLRLPEAEEEAAGLQ